MPDLGIEGQPRDFVPVLVRDQLLQIAGDGLRQLVRTCGAACLDCTHVFDELGVLFCIGNTLVGNQIGYPERHQPVGFRASRRCNSVCKCHGSIVDRWMSFRTTRRCAKGVVETQRVCNEQATVAKGAQVRFDLDPVESYCLLDEFERPGSSRWRSVMLRSEGVSVMPLSPVS